MKTIAIKSKASKDFSKAQDAAIDALKDKKDDLFMLGWYDAGNETGGPLEACGEEGAKCVADYAGAHGATYCVDVDGGDFSFYFTSVPDGTATLDRDAVLQRHANLTKDKYDNVQGG